MEEDPENLDNVDVSSINFVNPNFRFVAAEDELNCNTMAAAAEAEGGGGAGGAETSVGGGAATSSGGSTTATTAEDSFEDAHIYEDVNTGTFTRRASNKSRAAYHRIDVSSMGVDLDADPTTSSTPLLAAADTTSAENIGDGSSSSGSGSDSQDVNHVRGPVNDDLYAVVQKKSVNPEGAAAAAAAERNASDGGADSGDGDTLRPLPAGWQRHQDEEGPYYWHIKSGTIQRQAPTPNIPLSASRDMLRMVSAATSPMSPSLPTSASTDFSTLTHFGGGGGATSSSGGGRSAHRESGMVHSSSTGFKHHHHHSGPATAGSITNNRLSASLKQPTRYAVRSLGWLEISEQELSPERSSRAVNKCIVDLSLGGGRHRGPTDTTSTAHLLDPVGCWGHGKDLYLELDYTSLKLINPSDLTVLHVQPIHSIRVWGVGRDNNRDFAYVSRDRVTKKHMCHVFRCDSSARLIANTLRDICKQLMSARTAAATTSSHPPHRPNHLATTGNKSRNPYKQMNITSPLQSFPTPMEEPKKMLKSHYLGSLPVNKPTGMDTINTAIDDLLLSRAPDEWRYVHVGVAPSTVTIQEPPPSDEVIAECRVRFLSFLGIGRNVKTCAFIMHTAADQFICHVFHCEPSSGALCKTIEAACKLRYQKCLDAQPNRERVEKQQQQQQQGQQTDASKLAVNVASSLKSMWGHIGQLTSRGGKMKS